MPKRINIPFPSEFFIRYANTSPLLAAVYKGGYRENSSYLSVDIKNFFSPNALHASALHQDLPRTHWWFGNLDNQDQKRLSYSFEEYKADPYSEEPFLKMINDAKQHNITLTIDEAKALYAFANSLDGQFLQGGVIKAPALILQRWLAGYNHAVTLNYAPLQITRKADGSLGVIYSATASRIETGNEAHVSDNLFTFSYECILKQNQSSFTLTVQDINAHLEVAKNIWNLFLLQAKNKLKTTLFQEEDCFLLIPFLVDKEFEQEFMIKVNQQNSIRTFSYHELTTIQTLIQTCFPSGNTGQLSKSLLTPLNTLALIIGVGAIAIGFLSLLSSISLLSTILRILTFAAGVTLTALPTLFNPYKPPQAIQCLQEIMMRRIPTMPQARILYPRPLMRNSSLLEPAPSETASSVEMANLFSLADPTTSVNHKDVSPPSSNSNRK